MYINYSLWELDKCKKLIDGTIFNVKKLINDDDLTIEGRILKVKRLSFLAKVYL